MALRQEVAELEEMNRVILAKHGVRKRLRQIQSQIQESDMDNSITQQTSLEHVDSSSSSIPVRGLESTGAQSTSIRLSEPSSENVLDVLVDIRSKVDAIKRQQYREYGEHTARMREMNEKIVQIRDATALLRKSEEARESKRVKRIRE